MRWFLSPAIAVLIRTRNSVKLPVLAAFFTVPLLIAAAAQPFAWLSPVGVAVVVSYLFALYVGIAHYQASEEAWKVVRTVASLLNERDLRGGDALLSRDEVRTRLGAGQFSQLFNTLSDAHRSLRELVGQARASSETARRAADELAAGNVAISSRTEEQASTLEETAAAMEQLSSTIRENADSCRAASELVAGATVVARKGAGVANQAVATMDLIEKSAKRIADIISVIDGIAFQTNILALNAAVEAARAGEQGRGFAVVASEVRSLAQRSAQAAREIKALIGDSVANVGEGTRLVTDTGRIINEVTASVEQVNELIGVIAIASREQSTGVDSVNRALVQLQGVTQQNAAVVQDAAYSAVTLKEEAGRLFELVSRFRMDEARPAAPAPPPRKRLAAAAEEEWQQF